jgi:predicted small metal-binding protein
MARKTIDCRDFPGPCTLAIAGEEDEVVEAQAAHLAAVHDMGDKPEVRAYVRSVLKDEALTAPRAV